MMRAIIAIVVALTSLAGWAPPARALEPAPKCEAGKLKEAGKYGYCRLKAESVATKKGIPPDYNKCAEKFKARWAKLELKAGAGVCPTEGDEADIDSRVTQDTSDLTVLLAGGTLPLPQQFPATGQTTCYNDGGGVPCVPNGLGQDGQVQAGAPLAYMDNADGTLTDLNTGLMWEKKYKLDGAEDLADLNDADNRYPWSGTCSITGLECQTDVNCPDVLSLPQTCQTPEAAPTIFQWLAQLNATGGSGFAGYSDWRIPNAKELFSIVRFELLVDGQSVDPAFHGASCGAGCDDLSLPQCACTAADNYWSATSAGDPVRAMIVHFNGGIVDEGHKSTFLSVRAVRGGL